MQQPTEIKLHRRSQILELVFVCNNKTEACQLSAEYLRVFSPSAEVRGHGKQDYDYPTGKQRVGITAIDTQGNYGLKIHFSDNHNSGIYTWTYLKQLNTDYADNWENYLQQLHARNKTRDPSTQVVKLMDPDSSIDH